MKTLIFPALLLMLSNAFAATVAERSTCSVVKGKTPYSWCLTKPEKASSEVLYVLHGMGFNERIWIEEEDSEKLRKAWAKNKRSEPWVITIDFPAEGNPWALEDNLRGFFVKTLMPAVEKKIPGKISSRSVIGYSMNGFSVVQLWLKNPELFQKFAALCPAITEPKVKKPGYFAEIFGSLVRNSPFDPESVNAAKWNRHDPMVLAKSASPLTKSRQLLINYNEYDDMDFQDGAERFLELAGKLKLNVRGLKVKETGHCENLNYNEVAKYL